MYGDAYVPDAPRRYERKVKNAQEAHEAIRPAGRDLPDARSGRARAFGDELRLYELIWKRTVASQMNDATGTSAQIRLVSGTDARRGPTRGRGEEAEFSASGRVIAFPGFLRAYVEGRRRPRRRAGRPEFVLPALAVGDVVDGTRLRPGSHTTQPPARYTEASLVKAMEELGVGRPSTYASVIATILDRGYVWKKGTALVPSFTAFAVVGLLERYFGDLVDYGFTATMEDDLDEIASGSEEALPWLTASTSATASPGGRTDRRRHGGRRRERRRTDRARRQALGLKAERWPPTWARSTPARSTRSRSAPERRRSRSWPGSAATGPTSSAARTGPRCPTTWPPTS